MHTHDLSRWTHDHRFDAPSRAAERGTLAVFWITSLAMIVEVAAGLAFGSMALLADGWHMGSHAVALGLSAFAYVAARRYAADPRFAFGTWKIEVLAGFSSALLLAVIAAWMAAESLLRLLEPRDIRYAEAIAVATLGFAVNVACALILMRARSRDEHVMHDAGHHHAHDHGHGHHDLNLRSAIVHVAADALTSVLAIVALAGGMLAGWGWLDPLMGIIGAALIALWSWGLLRDCGRALLDREIDDTLAARLRKSVEDAGGETRVADLHLWRVGKRSFACILSVVTHDATLTPSSVKAGLARYPELAHVTVEIERCA